MGKSDAKYAFRFLDLFSGIGGFHQAMTLLGGKCIGASEIDDACIETYSNNFPDTPLIGDINAVDPSQIGEFEVLCAGFPCQPFSKAGKRQGFEDESRGKLFFKIMGILDEHPETEFLVLENVRNLADRPEYWETIQRELIKRNFAVTTDPIILSPSDFGIPQIRERVFILGIRDSVCDRKKIPSKSISIEDLQLDLKACGPTEALKVLDRSAGSEYYVDEERQQMLLAWDEFRVKTGIKVLGFPIWLSAMGLGVDSTDKFFTQAGYEEMPSWKQNFYRRNREFYLDHKAFIDQWVEKNDMLSRTKLYQKFEWNCGTDVPDIKHGIIQVRQSGVRVKRPNFFPALVAINNTPIIWEEHSKRFRKITPREASRLQSFDEDFRFSGTDNQQYKQLGNAINVEIVRQLTKGLLNLRKRN